MKGTLKSKLTCALSSVERVVQICGYAVAVTPVAKQVKFGKIMPVNKWDVLLMDKILLAGSICLV